MTTVLYTGRFNIDDTVLARDARAWERAITRYEKGDLENVALVDWFQMLNGCEFEKQLKYQYPLARPQNEYETNDIDMYRMADYPHYYVTVQRPYWNPELGDEEQFYHNVREQIRVWRALTECDKEARYIVPLIKGYQCWERREYAMLTPTYGTRLEDYIVDFVAETIATVHDATLRGVVVQKEINRLMAYVGKILDWVHNICGYSRIRDESGGFLMDLNTHTPRAFGFYGTGHDLSQVDDDDEFFIGLSMTLNNSPNGNLIARAIKVSPTAVKFGERHVTPN